jgi:hypothetical protein
MDPSLYPTLEYCVRALKFRSSGLSATAIERCTGIPHNLQQELLPNISARAGESSKLELLAREAMTEISEDQLRLVKAAISLWSNLTSDLSSDSVSAGHVISLRDVTAHAHAMGLGVAAAPIAPTDLWSGMVGRAEIPAPAESSLSLALRFLALNAFSIKQGEEAIGMRLQKSYGPHGSSAVVAFNEQVTASEWSETLDQRLSYELPHVVGLLLPSKFRFCRHCLENHFHSTFHQLALLDTCLLHASPILEACVHCASPVGTIESVLQKGYKAYLCGKCKRPICGNDPQSKISREFRQSLSTSVERFQQFADWASLAQSRLWLVEQLMRQNSDSAYDWGQWGCYRDRLLDCIRSLHPVTPGHLRSVSAPLVVLPWSMRLAAGDDTSGLKETNSNSETQTSDLVYVSALKSIAAWAGGGRVYDENSFAHLDLNTVIRLESGQMRSMAFAFVRMFCERPRHFSREWKSLTASDVRYKFRRFAAHGSLQRLPIKAVVLAYYNIVLSAMTMQRSEPLQRSRLTWLTPERVVPFVQLPEAGGPASRLLFSEGAVLSPVAADFRIAKLYRGSRSLD